MQAAGRDLRERVHLGTFVCTLSLLVAFVTVIALIQGAGMVSFNSDRLVANGLETLGSIILLTFLATFLLVEFFLIGIPLVV